MKKIYKNLVEIFLVSLKLGCTSFGGPIAHLAYFHEEYIKKRKWMSEKQYADLVALSQFLPGPASSQVGIGIGIERGGLIGGIISWLGFTFPSIILLIVFSYCIPSNVEYGWLHGLKIVSVAVVAHAILGMGKKLTPDKTRITLAIFVAMVVLFWENSYSQVIMIIISAFLGTWLFQSASLDTPESTKSKVSKKTGVFCLILFTFLLIVPPLLQLVIQNDALNLFASFYETGSFVFGGGHVVLPLLEAKVVGTNLLTEQQFIIGYSATQAVPGPLFTFASYLGMELNGILGMVIATFAIFLPAFLLIVGTLPFFGLIREKSYMKSALMGMNSAVVGLLFAALYDPIWVTTINEKKDFIAAVFLFVLLQFWKQPAWLVVVVGIVLGILFF